MQAKIEIKSIRIIADEEWGDAFEEPYLTTAEEVLLFQQHHNEAATIIGALQLTINEDVLSDHKSGMYSSILTFHDRSRLYREEDTLYKINDNIDYGANNE